MVGVWDIKMGFLGVGKVDGCMKITVSTMMMRREVSSTSSFRDGDIKRASIVKTSFYSSFYSSSHIIVLF